MSQRELVVLGIASQVPTRQRNHNGYLLRWDDEGVLFDPGEGTQRQMALAGVSATDVTRIAITHFHGDHCLGLSGIVQRINLDRVPHPVDIYFPASGAEYYDRLCNAGSYYQAVELRPHPIIGPGALAVPDAPFALCAVELSHPVESFGYRLTEPDGHRIAPERLRELGLSGPIVGRLQWQGSIDADARLAEEYGHLTAAQSAQIAAEVGARSLVLSHFSERYRDLIDHLTEATKHFDGEIHVATDLTRIPLPPRR